MSSITTKMNKRLLTVYIVLLVVSCAICVATGMFLKHIEPPTDSSLFGEYIGSSPCGEAIQRMLQIPADAKPDLIEWDLILYQDPRTHSPTKYHLRCNYGHTEQGKPGLSQDIQMIEQSDSWSFNSTEKNILDLKATLSLREVNENILQILNPDHSLMVGHGGWSYTLNRKDRAEPPVDQVSLMFQPELTYPISDPSTGPTVFGIFVGRTPCQGIARVLKIPIHDGTTKAKWRVTLYQDATTHEPTTYKAEGSLFRDHAREGSWSISESKTEPRKTIYSLALLDKPPILLQKGDDGVLFFLDQNQIPLVGNAEFSYTLNRHDPTKTRLEAKEQK